MDWHADGALIPSCWPEYSYNTFWRLWTHRSSPSDVGDSAALIPSAAATVFFLALCRVAAH